jgi:hypothetical protein
MDVMMMGVEPKSEIKYMFCSVQNKNVCRKTKLIIMKKIYNNETFFFNFSVFEIIYSIRNQQQQYCSLSVL